jgi:hypothetical protein
MSTSGAKPPWIEANGAGSVRFHQARGIGPETIAAIQAQVRHRLLSVRGRRGVLEREDAAMGTLDHGGGLKFRPLCATFGLAQ